MVAASASSSGPPWSTEKEKYNIVKLESKDILVNRNYSFSQIFQFGPSII